MIRYRADSEKWMVVAVECDRVGHPHNDADGKRQYENTHYDCEADAAVSLIVEADAVLRIETREVAHQRAALAKAEAALVEAALVVHRVREQCRADVSRKAGP